MPEYVPLNVALTVLQRLAVPAVQVDAILAKALGNLDTTGSITTTLKEGVIEIHPKRGRAIMPGPAAIEI